MPYPTRGSSTESQAVCREWWRTTLDQYKLGAGCARCGYREDPVALDLDHVDPSTKHPKMCGRGSGFASFYRGLSPSNARHRELFIAEVRKCVVLCANCHRIKTRDSGDYNT